MKNPFRRPGDLPPPGQPHQGAHEAEWTHQKDTVTKRDATAVFDQWVLTGSMGADAAMLTSIGHNVLLASEDELILTAKLDDITPVDDDGALWIFVEHSCCGRRWIQRSNQLNSFDPADADITLSIAGTSPGPSTAVVQQTWSDACLGSVGHGPLLSYARLRMFFSHEDLSGHLRIWARTRGHRRNA